MGGFLSPMKFGMKKKKRFDNTFDAIERFLAVGIIHCVACDESFLLMQIQMIPGDFNPRTPLLQLQRLEKAYGRKRQRCEDCWTGSASGLLRRFNLTRAAVQQLSFLQ